MFCYLKILKENKLAWNQLFNFDWPTGSKVGVIFWADYFPLMAENAKYLKFEVQLFGKPETVLYEKFLIVLTCVIK